MLYPVDRLVLIVGTSIVGVVALIATMQNAETLLNEGGAYALIGGFMTVFFTIILLFILLFLCTIIVLMVLFAALQNIGIPFIVRVLTWLDRKIAPDWTDGREINPQGQTWKALFGNFMEFGSPRRYNACRAAQLGALPIAATLVCMMLKL